MKKLKIEQKYNNKKIIDVLQKEYGISSSLIFKTLRKKDIKLNGKRINQNIEVYKNDELEIYIPDEQLEKNIEIKVIYEDENLAFFYKPKGIEVLGDNSLTNQIQKKYASSKISPCHRLDRNTDGIILYAKTEEVREYLFNKFKTAEIEKHYRAMVYGIFKEKQKVLTDYLFKDSKKSMVYISAEEKTGYRKIVTEYKVIEENIVENYSIIDVCLHTGKTHQIRAHMSFIGHPIIGDGKYGDNKVNKQFNKKMQELTSYSIKFNFKDEGILNYLNNKEFKI